MKLKQPITIVLTILLILQINSNLLYARDEKALTPTAKSAILMDASTGRILYSKNANEELPMASTTKIMTALIALDKSNLDKKVKIKKDYVGVEGSSIYLVEDEEISIRDLLYGLMLRSGNDSATAIAGEIAGSTEGFSELMNKRAKNIGALNSNFKNPHGLHDEDHYTTAYDLAIITREAMKYKEFRDICKSKTWTADRDQNKVFNNKNKTLWQYEGGNGGKTGFTKAAGRCLVSTSTRNGIDLISVVINDGNWFSSCYNLMDYGYENYNSFVIYSKDQFIKSLELLNGNKEKINIVTKDELIIPLRKEERKNIKIVTKLPDQLDAPIKEGQSIGYLQVLLEGELIATTELISKSQVDKKSKKYKIKELLGNII